MKITHLALANIRNAKSATFSLFILIFIAALLLNTGLTVMTQMSTFYDKKVAALHDPHVSLMMNTSSYKQSFEDFILSYDGVEEMEVNEMIIMNAVTFRYGNSELNVGTVLMNADEDRSFSPIKLIEELDNKSEADIYMPYGFKSNGGYKLGDSFVLSYQDIEYRFRVAGFFEETMLGTQNTGIVKFQLPEGVYRSLANGLGDETIGIMMSAMLEDSTQSSQLMADYNKLFPQLNVDVSSSEVWGVDVETVKTVSMMTIQIIFIILVAFSIVMVLISIIVIKFRVSNSIEDGMVNIGVLKAVGYTSWQLLASMLLQFMLVTLFAGVLGVATSYAVMPFFGGIITTLSGLIWTQSFNGGINAISVLVVTVLVIAVTLLSALRIRKLPPVVALRGGIKTHSFRKNRVPLDRSNGGLHFLLACKTMLQSGGQNIMIILIIAAISFASVFSVVLYYNIGSDKQAFLHLTGTETSNVMIWIKPEANETDMIETIKKTEGVSKVTLLDLIVSNIDGQSVYTNVSDDFSKLNNNTAFEGRHPKYDNEISLSWFVSKQLDKGIGDTVEVEAGGTASTYLITGLSQSMDNMGHTTQMTMSGVEKIIPNYKGMVYHIYLEDVDNANFIHSFKAQYGNLIQDIIDVDENIESQSTVYVSAVFTVMVVILATTMLVVVLILYLVIKTMILKRKKEFGIMKAIGYTTFQLMNQIAMSFVPIVMIGVAIGFTLGSLFTNAMLSVLLSSMGVRNVQFIVHLPLIIMLSIGIIVLAYLVSMILSRKIKNISVYGLITE